MHIKERQKKPHKQRRREQLERETSESTPKSEEEEEVFPWERRYFPAAQGKGEGPCWSRSSHYSLGKISYWNRYSHGGEGGKCEEEEAAEGNFYILTITLRQGVSKWLGESLAVGQG